MDVSPERDAFWPRFADLQARLRRAVLRAEAVVADAQATFERVRRTQATRDRIQQETNEALHRRRNGG